MAYRFYSLLYDSLMHSYHMCKFQNFVSYQVIEQHGGQVDPSYSNRVTHVLCANQKSDVFLLVRLFSLENHTMLCLGFSEILSLLP